MEKAAHEYFKQLNPIASRIYSDLQDTKEAYEDLWCKLTEDEKKQILNESIIKPEILLKYRSKNDPIKQDYEQDMGLDDHCSFRDEHSAPFSFRTKSQKNLTIFKDDNNTVVKKNEVLPKKKAKAPPKPKTVTNYAQDLNLEEISCLTTEESQDSKLPKTGLDFLDNW
ncbi:uncharacterized protein C1orf198-like [Sitophilus oryzae]|uniref:Uncharacterized protein C1orf198-like n=1 Tax=Sitophilus oryzae TaxID=7048 RepID=A0A6J2YNE1_SITOR|nr:uncharacterized protein C1orf198-like [Sitophilus oryzae]